MESRGQTTPDLFGGVTSFSDGVTRRIIQSEIEGGVYLGDLPDGSRLEVETENRSYWVVVRRDGAEICGHPVFCPSPVKVHIHGSSWGGSMLKVDYIGRGMHLEFQHPEYQTITTSKIIEIRSQPS
jgi:hypothetical protein